LEQGSLQRSSETNSLQQSKDRDSEELRSRVSFLEAALADAESSYQSRLQEHEDAMKSLTESKRQTEEQLAAVRDELGIARAERDKASGALESELAEERQNREQAQQSFDRLEQDRQRLVSELDQLHKALESARDELDAEKDRFAELEEKNVQEFDHLKDRIHELSTRLEEEQQSRLSEGHNHESAFSTYKQQHDMAVMELQQDLERLKEEFDRVENSRLATEEEKTILQQQMTDLVAKIEQNKTVQRHFEGQIQER
jgi:chromosome segregation ATPase